MDGKMKYTIIFFVALIAQSCSNKKIGNDWTRDKLQGKVLSYLEITYNMNYINIDYKIEDRWENIEKAILSSFYTQDTLQKKYDDKGNMIEENRLGRRYTYKYDDKGNMIEENWYSSADSLESKETYKYDDKGNMIEKDWYSSADSLERKDTYKYEFDKQGNWVKRIFFLDGQPKSILLREYNYYD